MIHPPTYAQEYWYFVGQGSELSKTTGVKESTAVGFRDKKPDQDLVLALAGPSGPLGAGALPKCGSVTEAGEKALHTALNNEVVTKIKRTPKTKEEAPTAEEMGPKSLKTQTLEMKEDVLKAATEARKFSISLKHLNYSGELVSGMMQFSQKMETVFEKITSMVSESVEDEDRWANVMNIIGDQMKWYKQAEVH